MAVGYRPGNTPRSSPLKNSKCKSMFLNTLGLKSDGMITEIVRAQHHSYDGPIAPIEDRSVSHPSSNKCDAEVIRLHINSYNPTIRHYKTQECTIQVTSKFRIVNKGNVQKLFRKQRKQ